MSDAELKGLSYIGTDLEIGVDRWLNLFHVIRFLSFLIYDFSFKESYLYLVLNFSGRNFRIFVAT